jgi:hypothetical protein
MPFSWYGRDRTYYHAFTHVSVHARVATHVAKVSVIGIDLGAVALVEGYTPEVTVL